MIVVQEFGQRLLLASCLIFGLAFGACSEGAPANPGTSGAGGSVPGAAGSSAGTTAAGAMSVAGAGAAGSGTSACGSESFAAIYRDIFAKQLYSCTAAPCHGRTMQLAAVGNLDMTTPAATYAGLVAKASDGMACAGKTRVKAGDAQNSLLVRKLRDATLDCGVIMPAGANPIADADLMRIVAWINGGACNN